MERKNMVVFDLETTGVDAAADEILQISAIDGNGTVLINEYCKPEHVESWTEAAKINGITPEKVAHSPHAKDFAARLQQIFDNCEVILGYNTQFDLKFAKNIGVEPMFYVDVEDVMLDYAKERGEYRENGSLKWHKLTAAAEHFGYKFNAHDSLEDVRATLYVYEALNGLEHHVQTTVETTSEDFTSLSDEENETVDTVFDADICNLEPVTEENVEETTEESVSETVEETTEETSAETTTEKAEGEYSDAFDKLNRFADNLSESEKRIIEHLKKRCNDDPGLCEDIMQSHKTWARCWSYIRDKAKELAQKQQCVMVDDDTVFEWAEDYFRLDDKAKVEEEKRKAAEAKKKSEAAKTKSKTKPAKAEEKKKDDQIDLFSFFAAAGNGGNDNA